jgi:predicted permease
MESFLRDLKFGFRLLAKRPVVTLIIILSIAIGVSANTTVFCWIEALVLHPLPAVPKSDQLVTVATRTHSGELIPTSYADYKDYSQEGNSLTGITAIQERPLSVERDGHTQRVWAMLVTGNFFDVLDIKPVEGRFFQPTDQVDTPGGQPLAVISYDFWKSYFGGDPSIVGQPIKLNRQDYTIVGVAPPDFKGTVVGLSFDIWVPLLQQENLTGGARTWITNRKFRSLHAIARLKPGVSLGEAQAEMNLVSSRLVQNYRTENLGMSGVLFPLSKDPFGAQSILGPLLTVLLLASFVVLLIVCSNLANILLVQAAEREKEIGVRLALGAGKKRIFLQMIVEGLILSFLAAILSLIFTFRLAAVLKMFVPAVDLPVSITTNLDPRVLVFALLLSLLAGLIAALAPAWRSTSLNLITALKDATRGSSGGRAKQRLRTILAVSEIALALVALIAAGLLIKSFHNVAKIDPGFDYEHVLLVSLTPSSPGHNTAEMLQFYKRAEEKVQSLPSVRAVSYAEWVPLGLKGGSWEDLTVEGYTPRAEESMRIYRNLIDDSYFEVMRVQKTEGRYFNEKDSSEAPAVAIVNQTFAKRYINGANPIGHRINGWGKVLTIVGVVKNSKYANSTETAQPYLYVPFRQFAKPDTEVMMHIAVQSTPQNVLPIVRREIDALNSVAYVSYGMPLKEYIGAAVFKHKMAASLLTVLGITALLLAALGIYGVMSYSVSQRTNEIGIRMALGASSSNILKMIIFQAARMAAIGLIIGVLVSLAVSRFLAILLYDVNASDPATFLVVSGLILGVALLASGVPAYRASRMNVLEALHLN